MSFAPVLTNKAGYTATERNVYLNATHQYLNYLNTGQWNAVWRDDSKDLLCWNMNQFYHIGEIREDYLNVYQKAYFKHQLYRCGLRPHEGVMEGEAPDYLSNPQTAVIHKKFNDAIDKNNRPT